MEDQLKKESRTHKKKEKKPIANIITKTSNPTNQNAVANDQANAITPALTNFQPAYWHMTGDSCPAAVREKVDEDSRSKIRIRLQDIKDAHNRIKDDIILTPVLRSKYIAKDKMNLYFKCENLQHTGSFKARGACNVLACLSPEDKSKGCIISGGRNFLQAMTYCGYQMSVPVNVVLPKDTPIADRQSYKENYAILKIYGSDANEANIHALCYCDQIGAKYIHGSDRIDLIAGYGTIGLELLAQLDKIDCVICPVGSGGLAAGVIVAIKSIKPNCLVYGVECSSSPAMTRALQEKQPQMVEKKPTIADSLQAFIASSNAFHVIRGYIDRMITVDETNISRAMIALLEREKMIVEGAGACAVAAIIANKTPELFGKRVVCILSGANVLSSRMSRVIDRGLASEGRLVKVSVTLPDAPGALAKLLSKMSEIGVDVRSLLPERTWMKRDIYTISAQTIQEGYDLIASGSNPPPHILTFNEIKLAADRNDSSVIHTPLCEAKLSKNMDYDIYLKCENLQYTGNCAERGIRSIFTANQDELAERGVIVPSNGNMALGAAYHGAQLGIPVTVIMPDRTPPATAQRCSELGADVVLVGETLEDVHTYTRKVYQDAKQVVIRSDEPLVMAGLGTVGLEIVTQLPELDAVIVPVSSGALLASTLVACKKLKCSCLVYGAECSKVPKMMKALQAGWPVPVPVVPNLADGLNAPIIGANSFATIKGRLDRMLEVDEAFIARAVITVLERERLVVDGAGACAIAAVMQGLVPELKGKRAVCIISGGNIECGRLSRTIQRGLGAMGRMLRFAVAIPDHRSGLEKLAKVIIDENAVLKSLVTEQLWLHSDVGTTWANVVVETANEEHSANIKEHLREVYPSAKFTVTDLEDKRRH